MTELGFIADPDLGDAEPPIDLDRGLGVVAIDSLDRQVRRWVGPEGDLVLAANSRLIGQIVGLIPLDSPFLRPPAEGRRGCRDARDVEYPDDFLDDPPEPFLEPFVRKCRRHEPHRPIEVNHAGSWSLAAEPQEGQIPLPADLGNATHRSPSASRVESMIAVALLMNGPDRMRRLNSLPSKGERPEP